MGSKVFSPVVRIGFDLIDARSRYVHATQDFNGQIYQMLTKLISHVVNLSRKTV